MTTCDIIHDFDKYDTRCSNCGIRKVDWLLQHTPCKSDIHEAIANDQYYEDHGHYPATLGLKCRTSGDELPGLLDSAIPVRTPDPQRTSKGDLVWFMDTTAEKVKWEIGYFQEFDKGKALIVTKLGRVLQINFDSVSFNNVT